MIEERAKVSRVGTKICWVRPLGAESCARCVAGRGCGGGALTRLTGANRPEIAVALSGSSFIPSVGETVIIGIEEGALLRAALLAYGMPLLALLALAGFAQRVLGVDERWVALAGIVGMLLALLMAGRWLRDADAGVQGKMRPQLLRRDLQALPEGCAQSPQTLQSSDQASHSVR